MPCVAGRARCACIARGTGGCSSAHGDGDVDRGTPTRAPFGTVGARSTAPRRAARPLAANGARNRLARRERRVRRRDDRQHRVPRHRALVPGERRSPRCRGSSTPTTSSSQPSSSRPGASRTCSGAGACSSSVWSCSRRHRCCARSRRRWRRSSASGSSRPSARRSWCPRRWRSCSMRSRRIGAPMASRCCPRSRRRPPASAPRSAVLLVAARRLAAGLPRQPPDRDRRRSVLARRHLVESRAPGRRRMPDLLGALLFALAIAALVLGSRQGRRNGAGATRASSAPSPRPSSCSALFAWRCTWHRSPVIDLALLRIRTFSVANGMTVIAAAGFYGYTLDERPVPDRRVAVLRA